MGNAQQLRRPRRQGAVVVRRTPTAFDYWMKGIQVFVGKLFKQMSLTMLATTLGVSREWVLTYSSDEVSKRLGNNMGSGKKEDQNKLYSNNSNNGYSNGYDYDRYNSNQQSTSRYAPRANGAETFPGF